MDDGYSDRLLVADQVLMVALFILTFAWIALFFWSSVFGFIELLKGSKVPGIRWVPEETRLSSRVAVLMPVYNESSQGVFANCWQWATIW